MLGAVVFNAGALLALLVAAFPWDDMLGIPTETVSIVKILGALLLVGYFLRALSRDEDVRLPSTLPWLVAFTMLVLLSLMLSGDVASGLSKTLRYLLFAAFTFLFVQLVRSRAELLTVIRVLVISSTLAALYGTVSFVTGNVERVSGPIGEANDFAYVLASVLPFAVYLVLRDRRLRVLWAGCSVLLVLALFGTLSRGALVGLAAVVLWAVATRRTRVGGVLAVTVRRGRDAAAGVHAVAAADRRAPRGQEPGRAGQRRVARGVLVGRTADGRRQPDPRRRARAATASRARTTSSTTRSTSPSRSSTTPTSRCSPRAACRR